MKTSYKELSNMRIFYNHTISKGSLPTFKCFSNSSINNMRSKGIPFFTISALNIFWFNSYYEEELFSIIFSSSLKESLNKSEFFNDGDMSELRPTVKIKGVRIPGDLIDYEL